MLKNKGNTLMIEHYYDYDRGGLHLISHDKQQLKDLQLSLENRGHKCELLEDYDGGIGMTYDEYNTTRVNLTPELRKNQISLEERFEQYLKFADRYFVNGRPIPSYDFFTESEKKILTK